MIIKNIVNQISTLNKLESIKDIELKDDKIFNVLSQLIGIQNDLDIVKQLLNDLLDQEQDELKKSKLNNILDRLG